MKYSYTQFDSSLSSAMLKQVLIDENIKSILVDMTQKIKRDVFSVLIEQEKMNVLPNLSSLAMQHSVGDKF